MWAHSTEPLSSTPRVDRGGSQLLSIPILQLCQHSLEIGPGRDRWQPTSSHPPGPLLSLAEGRISHFVCPAEAKEKVKPRGWLKLVQIKHTRTQSLTHTRTHTHVLAHPHILKHTSTQVYTRALSHRYTPVHACTHTLIHKYKRGLGWAPAPLCLAGAGGW